MNNSLKSIIITLLLVVISLQPLHAAKVPVQKSTARPATSKPLEETPVQKLWRVGQLDSFLTEMKKSLLEGRENLLIAADPLVKDALPGILDTTFAEISTGMQQEFVRLVDAKHLQTAIAWFESPTGQRVLKAEQSNKLDMNTLNDKVPFKKPKLSDERKALSARFIKAVYSPSKLLMVDTMRFFVKVSNHTKSPRKRLSEKTVSQALTVLDVKIGNLTSQVLPYVFARTYKDLQVDEVIRYVDFLESDAGQWFYTSYAKAYSVALEQSRQTASLSLTKIFDDDLAVLSPYAKTKISDEQAKQLMELIIKRHGKPTVIRAMLDARAGEITINYNGEERSSFGRPNQNYVTIKTLMDDLAKSGKDIRQFYQIMQKYIR